MRELDKINDALDRNFHEEEARIVFWNDPEKRDRSDFDRMKTVKRSGTGPLSTG